MPVRWCACTAAKLFQNMPTPDAHSTVDFARGQPSISARRSRKASARGFNYIPRRIVVRWHARTLSRHCLSPTEPLAVTISHSAGGEARGRPRKRPIEWLYLHSLRAICVVDSDAVGQVRRFSRPCLAARWTGF